MVRKQKRRLHYISNVYVVHDSGNPENEGKVFLFKYGKKIFDKIKEAMEPQFKDETPMNPFDLETGANFKLKIRQVEGYQNYDKSEFEKPEVFKTKLPELYSLKAFLDPKNFKSYDELKTRLQRVLGESEVPKNNAIATEKKIEEAKKAPQTAIKTSPKQITKDDDITEDDLEYFKKLAADDAD